VQLPRSVLGESGVVRADTHSYVLCNAFVPHSCVCCHVSTKFDLKQQLQGKKAGWVTHGVCAPDSSRQLEILHRTANLSACLVPVEMQGGQPTGRQQTA